MRIYLIVLFLFNYFILQAQGFFPLQKGNIWQYHSANVTNPDLEAKVLRDTLLSNDKHYSMLSGILFGTNYLRQEGSKVYGYDTIDSSEYILFDYSAKPTDTLSRHSKGLRTVIAGGKILIPENLHPSWMFYERAREGEGSYILYSWLIQDSLGLTVITIEPGNSWRLKGALVNGKLTGTITGVFEESTIAPNKPFLRQNYPNPFNPMTRIELSLPTASYVSLKIFDLLGREVSTLIDERLQSGIYTKVWNSEKYSSGVYYCSLQSYKYKRTIKLLLQK